MKNKQQYTIYCFILSLVLSACGGPLNKSVTEPLTLEEVETITRKYDAFKSEYEYTIFPRVEKMMDNSLEKQKFEKLTYGDYIKFKNLLYNNDWNERFGKEWEQRFDHEKLTRQLDSMVDSIIRYWDNYMVENAPSTYVSVELIEIKKTVTVDPMRHNAKMVSASALLRVVPLRGKIDKISAAYTLYRTDRTDTKYTISEYLGSGEIKIDSAFDAPVVIESKLKIATGYPGLFGSWHDYVCDTPVDVIKEQCKLYSPSPQMTVNGEEITLMTLLDKKPSYIYWYKEAKSKGDTSSSLYEEYREKSIREFIDNEYYADKSVYISMRKSQALYEYNPLAYELCYENVGI